LARRLPLPRTRLLLFWPASKRHPRLSKAHSAQAVLSRRLQRHRLGLPGTETV
jgi:hypothetical protein